MVVNLLRPVSYLLGIGALLILALAGPASSEGYGDPAIVQDGEDTTEVQPGEPFSVSFSSNVECAWSAEFNGDSAPGSVGFDYTASFDAPTDPGTYTGVVECAYSDEGPFRPVAYSPDATYAAARDQVTTQTFTVVVEGEAGDADGDDNGAGDGDDAGAEDDNAAGDDSTTGANDGALADTGGSDWQWLALGAGLVIVGGGAAVAARRRKSA
jgi:LPXTG-motif cell wall-anchored protein